MSSMTNETNTTNNPQPAAFGISKIYESVHGDKVRTGFRVECECTSDDHAITMFVEAFDDDFTAGTDQTNVVLYFSTATLPWSHSLLSRIKVAWNVLIHGVNIEQRDILLKKQPAINIAHTILQAVELKGSNTPNESN